MYLILHRYLKKKTQQKKNKKKKKKKKNTSALHHNEMVSIPQISVLGWLRLVMVTFPGEVTVQHATESKINRMV